MAAHNKLFSFLDSSTRSFGIFKRHWPINANIGYFEQKATKGTKISKDLGDPTIGQEQCRAHAAPAEPVAVPVIEGGDRFFMR